MCISGVGRLKPSWREVNLRNIMVCWCWGRSFFWNLFFPARTYNIIITIITITIIIVIIIVVIWTTPLVLLLLPSSLLHKTFSRSYTRWCRVGLERYGERRLARRKSPILTVRTTRPLQRNGRVASFGEFPSDTYSRSDSTIHYGVTALLQPTTIATQKK